MAPLFSGLIKNKILKSPGDFLGCGVEKKENREQDSGSCAKWLHLKGKEDCRNTSLSESEREVGRGQKKSIGCWPRKESLFSSLDSQEGEGT
jgi:hypothetical protein